MTNLFKRFFTHKSKFLLIILCLLGMVFSYSCSCRNDSTGPGNDGNGGGQGNTTGSQITPSSKLSRQLMVVNSGGTTTTKPITITVADAILDNINFDITGDSLTKDNFDLSDGVLSLTSGFSEVNDTTEKDVSITIYYKKKPDAGKDDILSPDKEEKTFKIIKAKELDATAIKELFNNIGAIGLEYNNLDASFTFSKEDAGTYVFKNTDYAEEFDYNAKELAGKFVNKLSKDKTHFKTVTYNNDAADAGNNSITFSFKLDLVDTYDMGNGDNNLKIKIENVKQGAKWVL